MSVADTDHSFTIPTINIFTLSHKVTMPHSANSMSVVDSLLRAGYLSPTPITPTIAISLRTLEHYRLIRNQKPSFSIEAFAKVLCDSYSLPYRRRYRTILSDAFDVYLSLLRKVEKRMLAALGLADEPLIDFGSRQIADMRCFVESNYLLPRDFIDTFAHDIPPQDGVITADNQPEAENPITTDCSKNWKAAAGDEKKRMWGIFGETGIFVAVCRHGFLLCGELAKYPLAIISKVIELFGAHSLGAYDIGCSFNATIQSSTLAQQFNEKGFYAHNYKCQTKHHPLGIKGAGIEDFQCAECLFSAANHVAPVTRYATLNIISTESVALEEAKGDLEKWREEEIEYFRTLGDEPEWDVHAMALRDIESQTSEASSCFLAMTPSDYHFVIPPDGITNFYSSNLSQTWKAETQCRHLMEKRELILQEVAAMEVKMAISHRWQPSFPEYQETRLVVQRLFELQRLNISQTAYRMRAHIARSLQTRCKTIRKAVEKYNEAARDIPGHAPIEWSKVTHYNFLDEFSLLRKTHQDIREHPWTKPAIRETIQQSLRIQRAHKELVRCNVELQRLHTAIELKASEDPIYVVVKEYCTRRELVNAHLLARINQIYDIEGFTGICGPGVSKHPAETMDSSFTSTEYPSAAEELTREEAEVDLEDDMVNRDLATLVEYMTDL
ncbi:hypothetical protein C8R48DRAFT_750142 [Suillus tomentosus]|nr:hypothetical protein C8R48DRAFT_750142 [Suillus tomentosus]